MAESTAPVDSKSTISPLENRIGDQRASGRGDTAETRNNAQLALERLFKRIQGQQAAFTEQKQKTDDMRKELALFKVSPDRLFAFADLPISMEQIEQAVEALRGSGLNVKKLQNALGVFDLTELTRVRKALVLAGVTRETENFQGTNATFIELMPIEEPVTAATEGETAK